MAFILLRPVITFILLRSKVITQVGPPPTTSDAGNAEPGVGQVDAAPYLSLTACTPAGLVFNRSLGRHCIYG